MRMQTILTAAALAAVLAVPTRAEDVACRTATGHAVKVMRQYDSVFAGRVVSSEEKGGERLVVFDVARSWKGLRGQVTVHVASGENAPVFAVGGSYVVFANGSREDLRTDACAPNNDVAYMGVAMKQLDQSAGFRTPLQMPERRAAAQD